VYSCEPEADRITNGSRRFVDPSDLVSPINGYAIDPVFIVGVEASWVDAQLDIVMSTMEIGSIRPERTAPNFLEVVGKGKVTATSCS
jgi:hypothetical protein